MGELCRIAASSAGFPEISQEFRQPSDSRLRHPESFPNMHDGITEEGDQWLRRHFERYVKWAKDHNSLFILTFDDDDGNDDDRVPAIVVGAGIKPGTDSTIGNHCSLLGAIQLIYGLAPLAGSTATPLFAITRAKMQQREVLSRK
jgi:hypothetical protein